MTGTLFWSNTIWFILLAIITVIELAVALYKVKNRKHVLALFLIISGITFSVEATIFCFLKAYDYYPMIILDSRIEDGLMGNLFSQFSISASASLIAALNLKLYWSFIFAVMYGFIEELFLKLGIYSHNWYRTWMSIVTFILLFEITKIIYKKNSLYINNIWRYFFMFFGLYTLHMPIIYWIPILSDFIVLNTKILPDAMNSYALISLLNLIFLSAACMFIYFSKLNWLQKSILTPALYGSVYLAYKANLFYPKDGCWLLIFETIDIFGMYLSIFIVDKLMTKRL